MNEPIHIISLGAGVQSSTMALMAAAGEIMPMPKCAIFADTGAEPRAVYDQLDYLGRTLPFEIIRVQHGNLAEDILTGDNRASWGRPPFFVVNDNRKAGQIRRQCTGDYKLDPIRRQVRELVGLTRRRSPNHPVVTQWIGISYDEVGRMKPSKEPWQINRYPLVEMKLSRADCLKWLEQNGHPKPAKSACVFCPYRDDASWKAMRDGDPESFAMAVQIDERIRNSMPGVSKSQTFVHRSLTPLSTVQFAEDATSNQIDMFNEECEGMCGV